MKELIKKGKRHAYLYKGNTLIWEKGKNSYTYVRYRGQQITAVNTVNAPISEAVLNGQTLVNLINFSNSVGSVDVIKKDDTITVTSINHNAWSAQSFELLGMAHNKTYIACWDSLTYTHSYESGKQSVVGIYASDDEGNQVVVAEINGNQSFNYLIFTLPAKADVSRIIRFRVHATTWEGELGATTTIKGAKVLEYQEGMENLDIPYFEGMQSVQAPTVQTVGKNLYNPRTAYLDEANNQFIYNMIDLNPNSMYSFYAKGNVISFELYNDNNQSTGGIDESASLNRINFGTSSKEVKVKLGFYNGTTNGIEDVDFSNVQLQEGSVFTQYEQHKFNQLATSEEVVLRSLPNGVCDTYNTRTKEYVRRIEKVNIKDVSLIFSEMKGEYYRFGAIIQNAKHYQGNAVYCVSDKMLVGKTDTETLQEQLCMYGHSDYVEIRVVLHPSKVNNDSSKIEEYLATNPVMIQYELATPVVTAVPSQITDQNGNTINSLYAFNGTTHITTGSAALLPTVDIEVPSTVEMFLHNQREANEGTVYL